MSASGIIGKLGDKLENLIKRPSNGKDQTASADANGRVIRKDNADAVAERRPAQVFNDKDRME